MLILRTDLHTHEAQEMVNGDTLTAALDPRFELTELSIADEAMTAEDWDKVLATVLSHDRCITL